ncbi:hypothetical protein N7478_008440 [Penicillium angulare]|uniref:uncharacterized protein n=1 Tax=Penicillium angulare TaxID=116970 RepID=UPI0025410ED2|nr:uncharacterized protein N7478_008440 [Penicillium angulare]KAJ5273315.1 hypothetical protein N7478_008440 [Penicillium angulare]
MAISLANSCSPTRLGLPMDEKGPQKQSMWHRLGLRRWLGRDERDREGGHSRDNNNRDTVSFPHNLNLNLNHSRASSTDSTAKQHNNLTRRLSRRVGVGLPRGTTFKRQSLEQRDRLARLDSEPRRAQSADRRPLSAQRTRSPPPAVGPRLSAPEVQWLGPTPATATTVDEPLDFEREREPDTATLDDIGTESESEDDWDRSPDVESVPPKGPLSETLEMELEQRWILNLSMHFRDRSEREKFFVTYAESPNKWRRVTISCDYRGAPPDSLEDDLKQLRSQRDKCARIYESIRESLAEIQFYDTVTNLKVETRDGRLHVHVTEDVNETIPYPPISSIGHLRGARCVPENFLSFEQHLSGFVYKVRLGSHEYIKKEIPGPDTVDEFLYEINALHALHLSPNVIQVDAIVVDERQEVVKGLLINYASQGALIDILYEQRGQISFARRERWARQIVQGLCEIHESGYVQGDFTLSNIVVDGNDNAYIIDINRRGCPVGWEPPEIAAKIESNQRISMYIGVKTDLYQLGMTLWALAMEEDEPERQPRPLILGNDIDVPDYYRRLVDICLSPTPRHRLAAKDLISLFPADLLSRSIPAGWARDTAEHDLRPLITKGNGMSPFSVTSHHDHHFHPHTPEFRSEFPKPHDNGLSQHIFSTHPDQGKGSTPTLAGSNGGAAFLSRHSSASTLNHHEHDDHLENRWGLPDTHYDHRAEYLENHPVQAAMSNECPHLSNYNRSAPPRQISPSISAPSEGQPSIDQDSFYGHPRPHHYESPHASLRLDGEVSSPVLQEEQLQPQRSYRNGHARSGSQMSELPGAVPFLFHSILPINPALPIFRSRAFPGMSSEGRSLYSSRAVSPVQTPLLEPLSDSSLPINPALKGEISILDPPMKEKSSMFDPPVKEESSPADLSLKEEGFILRPELKEESLILEPLSGSSLPINPTLKEESAMLDLPIKEENSTSDLSLKKESSIHPLELLRNDLLDSQLPINPLIENGPIEFDSPPPESQTPIHPTPQRVDLSTYIFSLLESRLPISPAAEDGPVKSILPTTKIQLPPSLPVGESQSVGPSLLESRLPINPASRS